MKKTLFTIAMLAFVATSIFAQKKIKGEGYVKYELTEVNSDDPMAGMMKGSTMEMHITDKQSYTGMNMMSGMVTMNAYGNEDGSTVTLMSMMGRKIKMVMSKEEIEAAQKETDKEATKMEYTKYKKDTKVIAGYKCYKVIAKNDASEMTLYVTDKINIASKNAMTQNLDGDQLGGFPLEFTISQQGMGMTYSAKEVSGKVDKSVFEYDDEGYKEMTEEELEQMGMGGGMGF